ncbi:MAG: zeta toxin family protein, partial [Patescibacteria group bacterium]
MAKKERTVNELYGLIKLMSEHLHGMIKEIKDIKRFKEKPVRIDADEIRAQCPGYNGGNSSLFQKCADKGVNILYDFCLKNNFNIILDATFAYGDAMQNIERS